MYHFAKLGKVGEYSSSFFRVCWIAVKFFFLLSGSLQAASAEQKRGASSLVVQGVTFLWFQKCKRFFSYLLTSYLGLWCCMGAYAGFIKVLPHLPRVLGELSLTYMSGLGEILLNRPLWYLSALLICNAICYPLFERRFEFL